MDNSSAYLYDYARNNGRLELKWERLLLSLEDPEWIYCYAMYIIKGRWPEAEEYIIKNPRYACWYAYGITEGRWPEAEEFIKKDPKWACWYAINIIEGRWAEVEDIIKKDPRWWGEYEKIICNH